MSRTAPILVIGNVTRDVIGDQESLGGSAAYVSRTLSARGMDVALVTRAPDDSLLKALSTDPRIRLHLLPAESFTTFHHHFKRNQRQLYLLMSAASITLDDIPPAWRNLPFVFLVPVIGECDTDLLIAFPESELIVGAQGWLRTCQANGWVKQCAPPKLLLTARLLAVALSEADHSEADVIARQMARQSRLVALTRGDKAITVFEKTGKSDIAIVPVKQVHDTNGAGDVFTALLGLRVMCGDTVMTAATVAAQGATRYVASGMAILVDVPFARSKLSSHQVTSRIRDLIARCEIPEDPGHADNTVEWLLYLQPDAGEALQLAALAHDIDRATPERVRREDYSDYNTFKAAHARRGALLLRGILEGSGVVREIVDEACRLVLVHEMGGDPDSDLLKDADSISYFDINLPLYYQREEWAEAKRRSLWGYQRLSNKARKVVEKIIFADESIARLVREVIHESAASDGQ